MTALVTIEEAKEWLRVDGDDEDATIALLIGAASDAVMEIADVWLLTPDVPDRLKLATLARVAIAFDNRDTVTGADGEMHLVGPFRLLGL